jgi:hypothetical protein
VLSSAARDSGAGRLSLVSERRYFSPTQPQTLQAAVMLLYLDAVLLFLQLLISGTFPLFLIGIMVCDAAAGFGIANDRKWGYALGIASSFLPFVWAFYISPDNPFAAFGLLGLLFAILLIVVLLHTQSREYVRIWFK